MDRIREPLQQYLRELWDDSGLTVDVVEPFGAGHSGDTYSIELKGQHSGRHVLRLSPVGLRIAGPADVGRQGRIMAALSAAGLPVPGVLACTSEAAIDGRAFVLMELLEGRNWREVSASVVHWEAVASVTEVVGRIQALPPSSTGIGDEAPNSPQAELDRWTRLITRAPDWVQTHAERLRDALAGSVPEPRNSVLVHGDLHFGNLLFDGARIVAVLDWEIAQLGEPLLDPAGLVVSALRRRYEPAWKHADTAEIAPADVLELFGIEPARAAWFVALVCFKYASILGFNYGLHLSGKRSDPLYEQLVPAMSGLVDDGTTILDGEFDRLAEGVHG